MTFTINFPIFPLRREIAERKKRLGLKVDDVPTGEAPEPAASGEANGRPAGGKPDAGKGTGKGGADKPGSRGISVQSVAGSMLNRATSRYSRDGFEFDVSALARLPQRS